MEINFDDYFKVSILSKELFRITLSGFWNKEVANDVGPKMVATFRQSVDGFQGPFYVIADLTDFSNPNMDTKNYMRQAMTYAKQKGLIKTIEVIPKATMRLGVKNIGKKADIRDHQIAVGSMEEAFNVLRELGVSVE